VLLAESVPQSDDQDLFWGSAQQKFIAPFSLLHQARMGEGSYAMNDIENWVRLALGLGVGSQEMEAWQMAPRAVIVYAVTLAMIRLGKKRFMGKATAFDVILGIVLGSIVSRAITGNAPLVPALAATATLIALHSGLTAIACRSHRFGELIKGGPRVIVRNGRKDEKAMLTAHLTDRDLEEDLRRHGITSIEDVAEARLERNGDISVIKSGREPKVVSVAVADGVQTVRIELA
jgi:uncharacterized membrane protein YcaP (DUF421 family)